MVERASAVVDEQIILRMKFQYGTGDYFDPYEISKVEILDDDQTTVIETITGDDIIRDSEGNYHVVASAIATPKNAAYDKWYFTHPSGATEQTKRNTFVVYEIISGSTPALTVGTNSWVTGPEAEEYFAGRLGASTFWNSTAEANKIPALITAYKMLRACPDYTIDADEDAQEVKDAQCEMALFLLQHQADMDARQGLQAQGVQRADIVGETYDLDRAGQLAVPPVVAQLLDGYSTLSPMGAVTLERDEDEDVI